LTFELALFPVYVVSHLLSLPLLPELPGHEPGLPLHVDKDLANAGLDANGATATATITAVTAIANALEL
jgi:hypothetical protein